MKALAVLLVALLCACASQRNAQNPYSQYPNQYPSQYPNQAGQYPNQYPQYPTQYSGQYSGYPNQAVYNQIEWATVVGMREVVGQTGGAGAGAAVGALLGGVLGHQAGKGTGRDLATIGGAVMGGLVGHEMERNSSTRRTQTELSLQLTGGERLIQLVDHASPYRLGDRVRMIWQNGRWNLLN